MPRYRYMCHFCMDEFTVMHSWKDEQETCVRCESTEISKLLTRPSKSISAEQTQTVGQVTKEYIDSNKEILEDLKKDSRSENYEPS
tara:strand:+ start:57 stop:314 length:258 start_codon:yes stop_codon:yes gene_type:complete